MGSGLAKLGNAEFDDLDDRFAFVAARQEDVIGFEVTMYDAQLVRSAQTAPIFLLDFGKTIVLPKDIDVSTRSDLVRPWAGGYGAPEKSIFNSA